eukprot:2719070-Amphidinium_carterae.1
MQPSGTCPSIESANSSSSLHVDGSANAYQPSQSCYCYWQHYGYSYVDQYDETAAPSTRLVQACGPIDLALSLSFRQCAGLVLLGIVAGWRLLILVGAGVQPPLRYSFELLVNTVGDFKDAGRIVTTCLCDLMMVLSRRTPCKRCVRRRALALRARYSQALQHEDGDLLIGTNSEARLTYQPLSAILAGGARWGGKRRWQSIKACNKFIAFNPRTNIAYIASCTRPAAKGAYSTHALRKLAQLELRLALLRGEEIEGLTIPQWANLVNTTADRLVETVTGKHRRWGNTLDALLLAKSLNLSFRIVDGETYETLMSNCVGETAQRTIVWRQSHFYVLHKLKKRPTSSTCPYGAQGYSFAPSHNGSLREDRQGYSFGSSSRAKFNGTSKKVAKKQSPQKSDFSEENITADTQWSTHGYEQSAGYSLSSPSLTLAMRRGAGKVCTQVTATPSAPSASTVWNPNYRPYPFSPLFAKVIAHPPHDLARLMEATAFHTAKARDLDERKAFEKKLLSQDANPELAAFVDPTHLYHEYYAASVTWHQELLRSGAMATNPQEEECMITSVSTIQPPHAAPLLKLNAKTGALASKQRAAAAKSVAAPKAMPKRPVLPLRRAVSAVARRRAFLTSRGTTQLDTSTTIDLENTLKATPVAATLKPPLARKAQLTQRPPLPRRGKAAKQKITLDLG